MTTQKYGASALGLQRVLGLGQYKTVWTWLHKLRRAMVRSERDRLSGSVEVDELYMGGKERGARGCSHGKKALATEEAGAGIGRIRLRRVPDASAASAVRHAPAARSAVNLPRPVCSFQLPNPTSVPSTVGSADGLP